MKISALFPSIAASFLLAASSSTVFAADNDKTVTLTGEAVCAKCELHETKSCQNVLEVKRGDGTIKFYLTKNDVSDKFHDNICSSGGEKVTVTGTLSKKDGKEILTASKIEPVKK